MCKGGGGQGGRCVCKGVPCREGGVCKGGYLVGREVCVQGGAGREVCVQGGVPCREGGVVCVQGGAIVGREVCVQGGIL